VVEVERPKREGRQARLKSDRLDALRAARSLLREEKPALPRATGEREALRVLLAVRASAVVDRSAALNQLRALLVTCPEPLRAELRALTRARLLARCRSLAAGSDSDLELVATMRALRLLATRIETLAGEVRELDRELLQLSKRLAPALLAEPGIGPIGAAQTLVSWSHRGRFKSEAAFARLAGAPPIPASSGQIVRYRLDRGGDRKAQLLPAPDRRQPPQTRPAHNRLHRTATQRRQNRPRSRPLPQTLPRPPPLPTTRGHRHDPLTLIEAST
jgi:transposase